MRSRRETGEKWKETRTFEFLHIDRKKRLTKRRRKCEGKEVSTWRGAARRGEEGKKMRSGPHYLSPITEEQLAIALSCGRRSVLFGR